MDETTTVIYFWWSYHEGLMVSWDDYVCKFGNNSH